VRETSGTVDPGEIERFAAHSAGWWDPHGSFQPLHRINPVRLDFIRTQLVAHFRRDPRVLRPFDGLTLLDIGCGGGLVAEPMARLGFRVTGIDADETAITVARAHAQAAKLEIDYCIGSAEESAAAGESFDAVLALEVVEHLADVEAFFSSLSRLVKPGGAFIGATVNRTAASFALAILGAEYLLRWLPRGTHDWRRFLRPSEFVLGLRRHGLVATKLAGVGFDFTRGDWSLSPNLGVNYFVMAVRR
jgi:2-polyprenyl-6-hydroxyphenyl methylase/3-demethylubiquinone-9 3-methyltransferase